MTRYEDFNFDTILIIWPISRYRYGKAHEQWRAGFLQVFYSKIPWLFQSWIDNFPDLIETITLSHKLRHGTLYPNVRKLWKSVNGVICTRQASKYTVSITKHNRNSYHIQSLWKNSTLLSMPDNYVHCTMLFELILSLLLHSKEMFCHLLFKCCQLLLLVISLIYHSIRREFPCVTNVKFPVFSHFYNSLDFERSNEMSVFRRLRLSSSSRTASVSAFRFLSCFSFSCCSFF